MKQWFIYVFFSLATLFLLVSSTSAQPPVYRFDHLSTTDGLYSTNIFAVLEDSRGFVWIGTSHGLNRYDGYEVKRYDRPFDTEPLSNIWVTCLYEDTHGEIWIGTGYHGVVKYDPVSGNFHHFRIDPEDSLIQYRQYIHAIYQDRQGTVWIGSYGGLSRFHEESATFDYYLPYPQNRDSAVNFIYSMTEDEDGTFWIGTGTGICQFDRSSGKFQSFPKKLDISESFQRISCIHQDTDGIIWIGTYKGLFRYLKKEDQLLHIRSQSDDPDDHLADDIIISLQESGHDLWIATRNGLVKYDRKNDRFLRIRIDPTGSKGLSNNSINNLWLNDMGILWVATAWSGINKLDTRGNPFRQVWLKSLADSSFYSPLSFHMDKKGYLWVGACNGGLFRFDPQMNRSGQYNDEKGFAIDIGQAGLISNTPLCITEASDGTLWTGLAGWGPAIFDRDKEAFVYIDMEVPDGLSRPSFFTDILEDQSGTIWLTTDGLYKREKSGNRLDPFKAVDNKLLMECSFGDIYEDSRGNLYFGTYYNGLFCLRAEERASGNFRQYVMEVSEMEGSYKGSVWQTFEDGRGAIWVVSDHGLHIYNPEKDRFERINKSSDEFDKDFYQAYPDNQGNFWVSDYTRGLLRYNPENKSIKYYSSKDGLPFDGIVPRYWYQSEDGRLFIGGWMGDGNGFFYFHPDSITDNKHIPEIAVTNVMVGNEIYPSDSNISVKRHITLKHDQNFFSIQFAALDYTNPAQNRYAYYLEGLEDGWINSGNRHYANYTSVPPGEYIFMVKGSNNDGYWNEDGAALAVTILPPPWRTWWAYSLYGIFLIGLVIAWRVYDLKRHRLRQELEIEHIEAQKLKELDQLKSRFFANISHEFRTPLTLILGPLQKLFSIAPDEETKQEISIMQRNARRLQNLINQLLDLSKLDSGKMELKAKEENIAELARSYVQQFESLAKHKGITLDFSAEREDIPAFVDRDKIEKILYNLLGNAFKWTGEGGRIGVTAGIVSSLTVALPRGGHKEEAEEQCVVISISDTGAGIAPEKLPRIFDRFYQAEAGYTRDGEGTGIGLALARELAELHGGTITAESVVNHGSTFRVYLPLTRDLLKAERRESAAEPEKDTASPLSYDELMVPRAEPGTGKVKPGTGKDAPILLIVEDNADLRLYIRGYLDTAYRILEAGDGRQGLEMALESVPDLIISDVMLPVMDGFELCRKVKSDVRTSHIPVILLTAMATAESKLEGLETGADEYLYKPFNPNELIIRVHNTIEQRKKTREYYFRKMGLAGKLLPETAEPGYSSLDEQFLARARKIAEEYMSDPDFSVEGFAQMVGLSRSHLYRKMTALINLSPGDFIRSLRLSRAAQRLKQKSGTISEIAFDVGFNNLSYFSKCFHEQFGVLPSEYSDSK